MCEKRCEEEESEERSCQNRTEPFVGGSTWCWNYRALLAHPDVVNQSSQRNMVIISVEKSKVQDRMQCSEYNVRDLMEAAVAAAAAALIRS